MIFGFIFVFAALLVVFYFMAIHRLRSQTERRSHARLSFNHHKTIRLLYRKEPSGWSRLAIDMSEEIAEQLGPLPPFDSTVEFPHMADFVSLQELISTIGADKIDMELGSDYLEAVFRLKKKKEKARHHASNDDVLPPVGPERIAEIMAEITKPNARLAYFRKKP